MEPSIDPRSTPDRSILMLTGDYTGFIYEQDKGTTDATIASGAIDGYGTIAIQVGVDETDFTPRTVVVPLESQTLGQLSFGYGFNGITEVSTTKTLSESQGGAMLDTTFFMDTSTLASSSTLRDVVTIESDGRVYTMQIQFRNQLASQSFQVHPVYLSDEVMV